LFHYFLFSYRPRNAQATKKNDDLCKATPVSILQEEIIEPIPCFGEGKTKRREKRKVEKNTNRETPHSVRERNKKGWCALL
jgi:hypothetical protein